jgi:hypothetical protein
MDAYSHPAGDVTVDRMMEGCSKWVQSMRKTTAGYGASHSVQTSGRLPPW